MKTRFMFHASVVPCAILGLILITGQAIFAQYFFEQIEVDAEGLSSLYEVDIYESKVIFSGAAGVGPNLADDITFVYDEELDSTYALDIYDLTGIWKQSIADSLLFLLDTDGDFEKGFIAKYDLTTAAKDSLHLTPPSGWGKMILGDMHIASSHIFISILAFNPTQPGTERRNVPAIFKLDFDLNLVNTVIYETFEPSSTIVSLADDGNKLKMVVNEYIFTDITVPGYINYLVNVSFDGEIINSPFNIQSDYVVPLGRAGGAYPIAVTRSGNTLFGVNKHVFDNDGLSGRNRMLLHCVSPAGELLWTYENFAENQYSINARTYEFRDIHVLEDQSILLSGLAYGKPRHEQFFETAFITKLKADGTHDWTKLYYYKPGYVPEGHQGTLGFDPFPMLSSFDGLNVGPSGDIYVAGSAQFLERLNDQSRWVTEDMAPIYARLDANGCLTPQCEAEVIIGEPAVPNTTVVPGRSWIEQSWTETDTLTSYYRYAQDSIFEAGRFYVPVEQYNATTERYEPTEYAMRELTGMTIVRWDSADHIMNDKLMEVGQQAPFVPSYPGNIPFLPIQFRVVERDSVVTYDGEKRLRINYQCTEFTGPDKPTYTWIDGIGRLAGKFSVFANCGEPIRRRIACMRDGDNIIYKAADFDECAIISSTRRVDPAQAIRLFPNPTDGELNVANLPLGSQVMLYDALGKLVISTRAARVDVSALPGGVYWANILFEGKTVTRKVVVR